MAHGKPQGGKATPEQIHFDRIAKAVANDELPHFYANGFSNAMTNTDIVVVFERATNPVATVNLSYILAKTLAQRLGALVTELETRLNIEIPTTSDIDAALAMEQKK
jgi:hypothetical protein